MRPVLSLVLLCILLMSRQMSAHSQQVKISPENADQLVEVRRIGQGEALDLAWSHNGEKFAVAGSIGVWLFDGYRQQPHLLAGHTEKVTSVAFSPDGTILASASADKTVRLWEVATGKPLHILEGHTDMLKSVAFSPDGRQIASGGYDSTLRLWDTQTGELIEVFSDNSPDGQYTERVVTNIAFSLDGQLLAWGSASIWHDNTGNLWLRHGDQEPIYVGTVPSVTRLGFDNTGGVLISHSYLYPLQFWDTFTASEIFPLSGDLSTLQPAISAVDSTNNILAVGGYLADPISLWNFETQELLAEYDLEDKPITDLEFNSDGSVLGIIIGNTSITFIEVATNKNLASVRYFFSEIMALISYWERNANYRNSPDPAMNLPADFRGQVAYTSDLTLAAVESRYFPYDDYSYYSQLQIWNMQTATWGITLPMEEAPIFAMAFSPDNQLLVISTGSDSYDTGKWVSLNNIVHIWDISRGIEVMSLNGYTDQVVAIGFNKDGSLLFTGSLDGTIRIWGLPEDHDQQE